MSAGKYKQIGKYESDNGSIYKIRVQPETVTTANTEPTAAITAGVGSVRVGGGKRQLGIRARSITGKWKATGGTGDTPGAPQAPSGYDANGTIRIPILSASVFAGIAEGSDFAYLGNTLVVTSKSDEVVN